MFMNYTKSPGFIKFYDNTVLIIVSLFLLLFLSLISFGAWKFIELVL